MVDWLKSKQKCLLLWAIAVIGGTMLCYLSNTLFGPLNQDEGWYLYAARQVIEGRLPHKDFFFTQGILMPIIYACFGWAWSFAGILGGRLFTAMLSGLALWIACRTLEDVMTDVSERFNARLVCIAFLGLNLWYTYFTTIPKTYGLCTLGITTVFWMLARKASNAKLPNLFAALTGCILALLVDVRLSMLVLLPIVVGWLFVNRQQIGYRAWAWCLGGAVLTLGALFLPEIFLWRESFWETQRFHAAREPIGLLGVIGCLARVLRFNPVLCVATLFVGWGWLTQQWTSDKKCKAHSPSFPQLWFLSALALVGVHVIAPVPYDDYLVPAVLPFAMTISVCCQRLTFFVDKYSLSMIFTLAATLLSICASPIAQDWFVAGHDRFWVQKKKAPDLFILRNVAKTIQVEAARLGEDTLWTQDTYLAVEAGLRVPVGMEMGPFSKPQIFNPISKLAAWSGYTYALSFPSLTPDPTRDVKIDMLKAAYGRTLLTVPSFGQGGTQLFVAERTMP